MFQNAKHVSTGVCELRFVIKCHCVFYHVFCCYVNWNKYNELHKYQAKQYMVSPTVWQISTLFSLYFCMCVITL